MPITGSWKAARGRRDRGKPWGATSPQEHEQPWSQNEWDGGARPAAMPTTLRTRSDQHTPDDRDTWAGGGLPTPGLVDGEPVGPGTDGHSGMSWGLGYDERADSEVDHGRDLGAVRRRLDRPTMSTAGMSMDTELREIHPDHAAGSTAALGRGLNSLEKNNPDGYRLGRRTFRFVDRKMYRPRIVHDERVVPVRQAPTGLISPASAEGGRYASPYAYGLVTRRRKMQAPLLRRPAMPVDTRTDAQEAVPTAAAGDGQFFSSW